MALSRASVVLRRMRHSAQSSLQRIPKTQQVLCTNPVAARRLATSGSAPGDEGNPSGDRKGSQQIRFMDRLLAVDESGQSPVLRLLGYYSPESRAIGVAKSLYDQMLERSRATLAAEFSEEQRGLFVPKYEILAIHVYLTLQRLRQEGGSAFEKDVKVAMQTLFDIFWSDVRVRMMIEEHELTLLMSAKWIRQCERNFFSMALAFDEVWSDEPKMSDSIALHITSLKKDPEKIRRVHSYMCHEHQRLKNVAIEQIWDGVCWDAKYPAVV